MKNLTNHYETHLTLAEGDAALESIRDWARSSGFKWTQITLIGGTTPLQPMMTFWGTGSLEAQHSRAKDLAQEIAERGGLVVRVKIEADIDNNDVPQDDSECQASADNYFEHHIKVLLANWHEVEPLMNLAARHGGRLSRNARRRRDDGRLEQFVTQRIYQHGLRAARTSLEDLISDLQAAAVQILEVEQEYIVYDSAVQIDAGWLEPQ